MKAKSSGRHAENGVFHSRFESNYTRVEGISSGELTVTIRKDQPVWPEWTEDDEAEDIGGRQYQLVDGQWEEKKEEPATVAELPLSDVA